MIGPGTRLAGGRKGSPAVRYVGRGRSVGTGVHWCSWDEMLSSPDRAERPDSGPLGQVGLASARRHPGSPEPTAPQPVGSEGPTTGRVPPAHDSAQVPLLSRRFEYSAGRAMSR